MTDIETVKQALKAAFYADDLEWKVQSFNNRDKNQATKAMVVPYISSRAIMDRLDEVVGIGGWYDNYDKGPEGGVMCGISIFINGDWITKHDGAENSDIEAVKGGISNAFKRAAVKWGIGRYLYDVPKRWFDLDDKKRPIYRDAKGNTVDAPIMPRQFLPADATVNGSRPPAKEIKAPFSSKEPAPEPVKEQPKAEKALAPETIVETTTITTAENVKITETNVPTATASSNGHNLEWAKKQIIPDGIGVVMAGKTLGAAAVDAVLGPFVVSYLSGKYKNLSGQTFVPQNTSQEELMQAALLIYESDPDSMDAEKARRRQSKTKKA